MEQEKRVSDETVFHPSAFVCLIIAAGDEDTKAQQSVIMLEDLYQRFKARMMRELGLKGPTGEGEEHY